MNLLNLNISIKLDNTDEIIKLLEKHDVDICTLQEVMYGIDESCFEMYKSKINLSKSEIINLMHLLHYLLQMVF